MVDNFIDSELVLGNPVTTKGKLVMDSDIMFVDNSVSVKPSFMSQL